MTVGQKSVFYVLCFYIREEGMKVMYHIFLYRNELCGFDLGVKPGKCNKYICREVETKLD
jgi:hypothetical protein